MSAALPKNAARREHQRALPHAEVASALARVRESGAYPATALAFEFLVLTACRCRRAPCRSSTRPASSTTAAASCFRRRRAAFWATARSRSSCANSASAPFRAASVPASATGRRSRLENRRLPPRLHSFAGPRQPEAGDPRGDGEALAVHVLLRGRDPQIGNGFHGLTMEYGFWYFI